MLKLSVAAALLAAPAATPPAAPRCVTRAEIGDMTLVGAAILVEGVRSACRRHLPATAFLASAAGTEFAARMRAEGQRRLEPALAGVTRMAGERPNASLAMASTVIRGLMAEGSGTELAPYADSYLCRDANEILEIASTLTPDQMARFVGAFASMADRLARIAPPPTTPATTEDPDADEDDALAPRPASFAPRRETRPPEPVHIVPATPHPEDGAAPRMPRPPLPPFLCPQPQ
jgi:hypothetical protein